MFDPPHPHLPHRMNAQQNLVVIRITDDAVGTVRLFSLDRRALLHPERGIPFFHPVLARRTTEPISVHCDLSTFQWVASWVQGENPVLTPSSAIYVCLSAEFFGMTAVVDLCATYVAKNLQSVVELPLDLSCLSAEFRAKVASQISATSLGTIADPRRKLVPALWVAKMNRLIAAQPLSRCRRCGRLYPLAAGALTRCLQRREGGHTPETGFAPASHVEILSSRTPSALGNVYWRLWSELTMLPCTKCHSLFALRDYTSCPAGAGGHTVDTETLSEAACAAWALVTAPEWPERVGLRRPRAESVGRQIRTHTAPPSNQQTQSQARLPPARLAPASRPASRPASAASSRPASASAPAPTPGAAAAAAPTVTHAPPVLAPAYVALDHPLDLGDAPPFNFSGQAVAAGDSEPGSEDADELTHAMLGDSVSDSDDDMPQKKGLSSFVDATILAEEEASAALIAALAAYRR